MLPSISIFRVSQLSHLHICQFQLGLWQVLIGIFWQSSEEFCQHFLRFGATTGYRLIGKVTFQRFKSSTHSLRPERRAEFDAAAYNLEISIGSFFFPHFLKASNPIGSMYGMVTFTMNIPQMLAYIPYMDPMGIFKHDNDTIDDKNRNIVGFCHSPSVVLRWQLSKFCAAASSGAGSAMLRCNCVLRSAFCYGWRQCNDATTSIIGSIDNYILVLAIIAIASYCIHHIDLYFFSQSDWFPRK